MIARKWKRGSGLSLTAAFLTLLGVSCAQQVQDSRGGDDSTGDSRMPRSAQDATALPGRGGDDSTGDSHMPRPAQDATALPEADEAGVDGGEFGAYYTKIDSGEEFEKISRTGPYADIVVKLGDKGERVVFWRGSSYLPYWETSEGRWYFDEVVPRKGDGTKRMPDKVNRFSYARIIESTPTKAVVHWRYEPDFQMVGPYGNDPRGVDVFSFVDEYYEIRADRAVVRTVRRGTRKWEHWSDPANKETVSYALKPHGIETKKRTQPKSSKRAKTGGNRVRGPAVKKPVACWSFDEGLGDTTVEGVSGHRCPIAGRDRMWKKGVSGTALQFDGYTSQVRLPADQSPQKLNGVTLECWISVGTYPFAERACILQRGTNGLGLHLTTERTIQLCLGEEELAASRVVEMGKWYHVAATITANGDGRLYIDGKPIGGSSNGDDISVRGGEDILIGNPRTEGDLSILWGLDQDAYRMLDALLDEVRIYDGALSSEEVAASYAAFNPGEEIVKAPDMERRALPKLPPSGRFGGRYTRLKFYDSWDHLWRVGEHADVVVEFDELPSQFVFWRGTGYIPMVANDLNRWYSNEFNEQWNKSGGAGCQEPMSDKRAFFNHVRIIENTPARVVVHWRYPLIDTRYMRQSYYDKETGWGDWSDWYYYVYPDGIAAKKMQLWTENEAHEWQEGMVITGPDQRPEDAVEYKAMVVGDLKGKSQVVDWTNGTPRAPRYEGKRIMMVDMKGDYDVVTIGRFQGGDIYDAGFNPDYSQFASWCHWPVSLLPSDRYDTQYTARTGHSSLNHVELPQRQSRVDGPNRAERIMLEGSTNKKYQDMIPLAKSWLGAPTLSPTSGCSSSGYRMNERAYALTAQSPNLSFSIGASADSPIVNPCFVIRNWNCASKASLEADGKAVPPGAGHRQGVVTDVDGTRMMVIWLRMESTTAVSFTISGAAPLAGYTSPATEDPWRNAGGEEDDERGGDEDEEVPEVAEADMVLKIGAAATDFGGMFKGHIDDVAIYSVALKTDEIAELAAGKSVKNGLVAAYGFDNDPAAVELKGGAGVEAGGRRGSKALKLDGGEMWAKSPARLKFDNGFTWSAWIRTTAAEGTIVSHCGESGKWHPGGRAFFLRGRRPVFDIGWVGQVGLDVNVSDGQWHHVAVTGGSGLDGALIYVDGKREAPEDEDDADEDAEDADDADDDAVDDADDADETE